MSRPPLPFVGRVDGVLERGLFGLLIYIRASRPRPALFAAWVIVIIRLNPPI
ncbi:hypothetical protein [Pseudarthrobacter sp. NIBRBAC000502772]|uniref:hypothetical protein n=1 Tax=Pseudarthrobacter sp. NIBRBAC000502772 TaxID=2590775 RepID=UPI00143D8F83|nr:hypothetical protein [Pseudarthrobacter sp. NIBRBAC000502772]